MADPNMFDEDDRDPDEREQAAYMFELAAQMDDEREALERLADSDPLGFVFSGQEHEGRTAEQADAWLESRLHGEPAE
jgi:hypothetical protein